MTTEAGDLDVTSVQAERPASLIRGAQKRAQPIDRLRRELAGRSRGGAGSGAHRTEKLLRGHRITVHQPPVSRAYNVLEPFQKGHDPRRWAGGCRASARQRQVRSQAVGAVLMSDSPEPELRAQALEAAARADRIRGSARSW